MRHLSSDSLGKSCLQIWILVPWPVWHSTAAQAPAGALHWWLTVLPTSHHAPCLPSSVLGPVGLLREQSHMLGPVHHLSTQGHHSPSQPLALPLCSQCARSLPIHLLRIFSYDSLPPNSNGSFSRWPLPSTDLSEADLSPSLSAASSP